MGNLNRSLFLVFSLSAGLHAATARAQDSTTNVATDSLAADTIPADTTLLARTGRMFDSLTFMTDSLLRWEAGLYELRGAEFEVSRVAANRYSEGQRALAAEFVESLSELRDLGVAIDSFSNRFGDLLATHFDLHARAVGFYEQQIDELYEQRDTTQFADLDRLQRVSHQNRTRIDTAIAGQANLLTLADSIGLQTEEVWAEFQTYLEQRAESLAGLLQIAGAERKLTRQRLHAAQQDNAPDSEIALLRTHLRLATQRVETVNSSLVTTADILDARGEETSQFRRLSIEATGKITDDILDRRVAVGVAQDVAQAIALWIRDNAVTVLIRVVFVVVIILLFRVGFRITWWIFTRIRLVRIPRLLADLLGRMVRPLATITGLATGLWLIGVDPTALLTGLGVAGVIVGLALQDSMSNLAAGFFIVATRPFDVDDLVEAAGVLGKVKAIGLANTTIVTLDYRRLYVPNRKIWSDVIENRSSESIRRVQRSTRISYQDDVNRALELLRELLREHELVLDEPEPFVYVADLADSWVEINVWPYVASSNWWEFYMDLPRLISNRFEKHGIEFPLPARDVTVRGPDAVQPEAREL